MEQCPNCGSTVRIGAKFCTTCGFRLPEPAAPEPVGGVAARSPFASTSSVAASRWPTADGESEGSETSAQPTDGGSVPEAPAAEVAADSPAEAAAEESESGVIELGPSSGEPAPVDDKSGSDR